MDTHLISSQSPGQGQGWGTIGLREGESPAHATQPTQGGGARVRTQVGAVEL